MSLLTVWSRGSLASAVLAVSALGPSASLADEILVTARFGNNVLRYDASTGAPLGQFNVGGGLNNPSGIAVNPLNHVFVGNFVTNSVVEYAADGTFVGTFASGSGLGGPLGMHFGPDGNLYVAGGTTNGVYEYAAGTGAFVRSFTAGGLTAPTGVAFTPSGDLLACSSQTSQILRYDRFTGAFLGTFGSGVTLSNPVDMEVGPDGALYVSTALNNQIARYDFSTGVGQVFASGLSRPIGLAFDSAGRLLEANQSANNVLRFAPDGTPIGTFIGAGSGGLNGPNFLVVVPAPSPLAICVPLALIASRRRPRPLT